MIQYPAERRSSSVSTRFSILYQSSQCKQLCHYIHWQGIENQGIENRHLSLPDSACIEGTSSLHIWKVRRMGVQENVCRCEIRCMGMRSTDGNCRALVLTSRVCNRLPNYDVSVLYIILYYRGGCLCRQAHMTLHMSATSTSCVHTNLGLPFPWLKSNEFRDVGICTT